MAKTASWRALVALAAAVLLFPARAQAAGEVDLSFDASPIAFSFGSADVRAVLVLPDGRILIGGAFTHVQGVSRVGLARLHPNGALDTSFVPPFSVTSVIPFPRVLVRQPDGRILVGGAGLNVGATSFSVVRLLPDGAIDPSFTLLPMAVSAGIEAIALLPDGKILIGGDFSNIGPLFTNTIARLFPDGSRDAAFDLAATTDVDSGPVHAITLQPDGHILIGGTFLLEVSGQTFTRLARLRPDATVDTSFRPTFDAAEDPDVRQIVRRADGSMYAAGQFSSIGGVARVGLARLTAAGAVDTAFDVGNATGVFFGIVRQPDGKLVVTGDFFLPPDGRGIARLLETGAVDAFGPPLGLGPGIGHAITTQADGKLLVGGPFFNPGGVVRERVVRLLNDAAVALPIAKVVASGDPIPGGAGAFTTFPHAASIRGRRAVFRGLGGAGVEGVYGCTPGTQCTRLADVGTAVPGGTGTFAAFDAPATAGRFTSFVGAGAGQSGVYSCDRTIPTDPCTPLADLGTAIPGGTGTFGGFSGVGAVGAWTAFVGTGTGQAGVYACDRAIPTDPCTPVADLTTSIPGGSGTFTGFGAPGVTADLAGPEPATVVAFVGSGTGQQGVYACDRAIPTDPCTRVADRTTAVPGGSGTFTGFGNVALAVDPGAPEPSPFVLFVGSGTGQQGVYSCDLSIPTDPCTPVATRATAIPGGTGTFTGFGAVATSRTHAAFMGTGASGQAGIYVAGTPQKVVAVGDVLAGRTVAALRLGRDGLEANRLVFNATFTDGTEGVFMATLDLPGGAARRRR